MYIESLIDRSQLYITPGCHIQSAIDAAQPGYTVNIWPGEYNQNFNVNKYVEVIGSGSGFDPLTNTIIAQDASGAGDTRIGVIQLNASGVSNTEPILFQDFRLAPDAMAGFSVGRFTEGTATDVSYIKLDNVVVVGNNVNPNTEQERGLYVDLTSSLRNLTVINSGFDSLTYGWYLHKEVSADASTVEYVGVTGTTFNHNNHKGIYAEKLTEATFTNCTASENGFTDVGMPSYFLPWMCGIDINLKAGTYQNLVFDNCMITDNALGGAKEGVGLTVKGRGTGNNPSGGYTTFPAYVDNVQITGGTYTGNERGMRLGEPGKENATPTNVVVTGAAVHSNIQMYSGSDGSVYGDMVNMMMPGVEVSAESNYWGTVNCELFSPNIYGEVDYEPYCNSTFTICDLTCTITEAWVDDDWAGSSDELEVETGKYFNYNAFETINDALNVIADGGTIHVYAGEYIEQVVITKPGLSILGAGSEFDPMTNTIIKSPASLTYSFSTGPDNYPIVGVDGVTGVTISGVLVDGDDNGNANYRFVGIAFWNADGSVLNSEIHNVMDDPFSGAQHGVGIYAYNNTGGPYTIVLNNIITEDCQKTHVAMSGDGLTVDIDNVTATGEGPTTVTAQNGIQVGIGAGGTIDNSTVDGFAYTGGGWSASGFLLLDSSVPIDITGSHATNCQTSVYFSDASGSFNNGSVSDVQGDALYASSWTSSTVADESPIYAPAPIDDIEWENRAKMPVTVTVTNSVFTGADVTDSWGPSAYAYSTDPVEFEMTGCEVTNWDWGVAVYEAGGTITATINNNKIFNNGSYGVYCNCPTAQDAEHNWWGAYCGPYHETTNPDGYGDPVTDNVIYDPWCNEDLTVCTYSNSNPGPSEVWVDDDYGFGLANDGHTWCLDAFNEIQAGVDAAGDAATIHVLAGTYPEQVVVNKSLTVDGTDDPVIEPYQGTADSLTSYKIPESSRTFYPMFIAYGGTDDGEGNISGAETIEVDISGIHFDGNNTATTTQFAGLLLRNCLNSTVSYNELYELLKGATGNPETGGIMIYGNSDVLVDNNIVNDFSRVGIVFAGDNDVLIDPVGTASNNTVVGEGPLPQGNWAQNGIQFGYGATGTISGNEVYDIWYTGPSWAATGITIFYAGDGLVISGNNVHDCQAAIYPNYTSSMSIIGNTITDCEFTAILGGTDITIDDNTLTNNYQGFYVGDAVDVSASGNTIANNDYAFLIDGLAANLEFTGNTITGSAQTAFYISEYYGDEPVNVSIKYNSIAGNVFGIANFTTVLTDAEANWWGDHTGPATSTVLANDFKINRPVTTAFDMELDKQANSKQVLSRRGQNSDRPVILADGSGDGVSDLVDYSPWWGANYVDDDHSGSWTWYLDNTFYSSITDGIDYCLTGDSLMVTPGTYSGVENRGIDLEGKELVIKATETAHNTIIDCADLDRGFLFDNGETEATVLSGFTIINGNATAVGGADGGGINCINNSSPWIDHCVIIGNECNGLGGGISIDACSPTILNCVVSKNSSSAAPNSGGGIHVFDADPLIKNTIVWENFGTGENQIFVQSSNGTEPIVVYCDVQGGFVGSGNIDTDPLFRNTDLNNPDFHLESILCGGMSESPCIDAGHLNIIDIIQGCEHGLGTIRSDMGAYGGGSVRLGLEYVPGDANMTAGLWPPQVIGGDVTYLVNYFRGLSEACRLDGFYCSADVNGDCLVIGSDVTYLVNYFRAISPSLMFCPDYIPIWINPEDAPPSAPAGWPNCDSDVISVSKTVGVIEK